METTHRARARRLLETDPVILIYDTETTGFLRDDGSPPPRIWELAAVRRGGGKPRAEGLLLIDIEMPIPSDANIGGVDPTLPMREGRPAGDAFARFARHAHDAVLIGHNILSFDNPIVALECERLDIAPPSALLDPERCIDTLSLARELFPKGKKGSPENHKLGTLAAFLGIEVPDGLHRALADVALNERVLDALVARI